MPLGAQYANTMADLTAQIGNAQADAVRQKGQIWGQTMADLGQIAPRYLQMRDAREQRAQQQAVAGAQMRNLEWDNERADATEARATRMETLAGNADARAQQLADDKRELDQQSRLVQAIGALEALPASERQPAYDALRAQAGVEDLAPTYSVGYGRMLLRRLQSVDAQLKEMEANLMPVNPGDTVIDRRNPQAGAVFTAPAKVDPPAVGSFEDYVTRTYGPTPTPAQILEGRKGYNQSDDKAAGDVTALTPAGIDMAALHYRTTGIMPALGMGDKTTRQRIINRAAELTPEDVQRVSAGGNIAANKAEFRADSGSLAAMQKQRDAITSFEQTASKNIDIFLETAGKVVDTGSPLANRAARAVSGQLLGSPNVAAYNTARQVAINEVAKIISNPNMAGVLSDSARKEVEAFNPESATLAQTVAVMRILKRDMANRTAALDDTLAATRARLNQTPAQQTPPARAGGAGPVGGAPSYQDYLRSRGGK